MAPFPTELTGTWEIDPTHTTIGFAVKHAMVSTVRGYFSGFSGGVTIDAGNPEQSSAWLDIDPASISTNNDMRDGHLRSTDFFEVETHPAITFRSTGVKVDGEKIILTGDLTIRGVTGSVEVEWEFGGIAVDPFGTTRAGFEGSATVNRKDWGLTWNSALETGGVLVGDKVKLVLEVEVSKKADDGS